VAGDFGRDQWLGWDAIVVVRSGAQAWPAARLPPSVVAAVNRINRLDLRLV